MGLVSERKGELGIERDQRESFVDSAADESGRVGKWEGGESLRMRCYAGDAAVDTEADSKNRKKQDWGGNFDRKEYIEVRKLEQEVVGN